MKKYLLPKDGNFYKTNLHMHTTVSDGHMTTEETKKLYLENGYSVVAFSDHEVMVPHPELTDENFLALTATEMEISGPNPKTYHFNVFSPFEKSTDFPTFDKRYVWGNAKKYISTQQDNGDIDRIYDVDSVNELIKKCNEKGFLVSYNHPVWSIQNADDYSGLKGVWGVECFNTGCYLEGFEDTCVPLDTLLSKGEKVFALATDDAHRVSDCLGGWLSVKCDKLTYGDVFSALKQGNFYASTGPEIEQLYIDKGVLTVKCSGAKEIFLTTNKRFAKYVADDKPINEATFDIKPLFNKKGENDYFRLTITDYNGKRAWSNPYFIKDL